MLFLLKQLAPNALSNNLSALAVEKVVRRQTWSLRGYLLEKLHLSQLTTGNRSQTLPVGLLTSINLSCIIVCTLTLWPAWYATATWGKAVLSVFRLAVPLSCPLTSYSAAKITAFFLVMSSLDLCRENTLIFNHELLFSKMWLGGLVFTHLFQEQVLRLWSFLSSFTCYDAILSHSSGELPCFMST